MAYGTAGWAWTRISGTLGPLGATDTKGGWTPGGGLEYAFTDQLSIKAEYLHVRVPNFLYDVGGAACGPAAPCFASHNSFDVVRAGLNYRFGWGGPVVARY